MDVSDEAGARASIRWVVPPPDNADLAQDLSEARTAKEKAIDAQDFEGAARYRDSEREIQNELDEAKKRWHEACRKSVGNIDRNDIASVVAKLTGVPLEQMAEGESAKLLRMEAELQKTVVGQDEAVTIIWRSLPRRRADLKNWWRPVG